MTGKGYNYILVPTPFLLTSWLKSRLKSLTAFAFPNQHPWHCTYFFVLFTVFNPPQDVPSLHNRKHEAHEPRNIPASLERRHSRPHRRRLPPQRRAPRQSSSNGRSRTGGEEGRTLRLQIQYQCAANIGSVSRQHYETPPASRVVF